MGKAPASSPEGEKRVKIEDRDTVATVAIWMGLRLAVDTLEKTTIGKGLQGMQLALALLSARVCQEQMEVFRRTTPFLILAGVDLTSWQVAQFDGPDVIVCRPIKDEMEEAK